MKPVKGFLMQVAQGKELVEPVRHELPSMARPVQPESFYVVHADDRGTCIVGGPYPTEERAFGDISAITDTSGT